MRLLFVIKGLVVRGGGAERVLTQVTGELARRGHHVTISTFDHPGQPLFYEVDPAIRVHMMGASEAGRPTPRSNLIRIAATVRRLVREEAPDVVVAFMHSTYVPVAFGLIGAGVPLVLSEHTAAAHFASRPVQRLLARLAQRMAFAKTVVSQVVHDEHPPQWRRNLHVLPNPVDIDAFAAGRTEVPPGEVILCVGGLRAEKDQKTLIEAFDRVAPDFPGWRLRLVGDGVEREAVEARIAASPYRDRIELPGIIRDVVAEYRAAGIVAMPSRYEAMPMVAVEAMACGRPVVGFADCAGAAALIRDGVNGLLAPVAPDRPGPLADALRLLMRDDDIRQRLGDAAPATVEEYALDAITSRWEDLLDRAAGSRGRRRVTG